MLCVLLLITNYFPFHSVREEMYAPGFLPCLGHTVSLLLGWAQNEQLRNLRCASMKCLLEIITPSHKGNFWAHLCVFEPTCAYAWWALMHRFLSVWPSMTRPKVTRPKIISQQPFNLGSWNLVRTLMWMTLMSTLWIKVIGQRSRSPGQKTLFEVSFDHLTATLWGQGLHGSRSKVIWVKAKGQPWRERSKVKVTRA